MVFEKMDVYRVGLELCGVLEEIVPKRGRRDLRDQLERASASVVLNVAEGAGRRADAEKAHFYAIARGSATECAGALAVLRAVRAVDVDGAAAAQALIERVVMMLNKLIARFAYAESP